MKEIPPWRVAAMPALGFEALVLSLTHGVEIEPEGLTACALMCCLAPMVHIRSARGRMNRVSALADEEMLGITRLGGEDTISRILVEKKWKKSTDH
jgi:hypothetical protein